MIVRLLHHAHQIATPSAESVEAPPPVDHPGTPFGRAEDTLALVSSVDHQHLQLNLDLYHVQIDEGNLIETCRACLPWIGEVQVADVPGRCEPGTGEINYSMIVQKLYDMGYRGPAGSGSLCQAQCPRSS
ncbi:Hydroxypyruvate isomerase [compost metagenome]